MTCYYTALTKELHHNLQYSEVTADQSVSTTYSSEVTADQSVSTTYSIVR